MRPVVIVVVLPLPQLLVEEVNVVGDAVFVEQLIELLVVDPMGPFHLAIEMGCPRANVHMADVEGLQAPVEVRLEFGAVVSVCTTWTRKGKRRRTSSRKRIAVPWLQAS